MHMNRTQNSPKRRQEKQLSARRKHWNHMQVTDRPSPDAPSLIQAIIVQMVYCNFDAAWLLLLWQTLSRNSRVASFFFVELCHIFVLRESYIAYWHASIWPAATQNGAHVISVPFLETRLKCHVSVTMALTIGSTNSRCEILRSRMCPWQCLWTLNRDCTALGRPARISWRAPVYIFEQLQAMWDCKSRSLGRHLQSHKAGSLCRSFFELWFHFKVRFFFLSSCFCRNWVPWW